MYVTYPSVTHFAYQREVNQTSEQLVDGGTRQVGVVWHVVDKILRDQQNVGQLHVDWKRSGSAVDDERNDCYVHVTMRLIYLLYTIKMTVSQNFFLLQST